MEALQILILIVVVVTLIVKEKSKKTKQVKPIKAAPQEDEDDYEDDYDMEYVYEEDDSPLMSTPSSSSLHSTLGAQSQFEEGIPSTIKKLDPEPIDEEDLSEQHLADVKRGIIWSEILHRKY